MKNTKKRSNGSPTSSFHIVAGRLAVDFANTVVASDGSGEALRFWTDLVGFLVAVGEVDPERGARIRALEETDPEGTALAMRRAVALRNAVRGVVVALAERRTVEPGWVEPINDVLRVTEGHDELVRSEGAWRVGFVPREQRLEWLLAAVARSAAELVAEGPRARVRKCGNPKCVLYFYDASRTGRRRWCSMAVCGNRSKVAAFAKRKRRAGSRRGIPKT